MKPRLKSLSIKNFRSIRGQIVVPLDAQVVLVHGSNGMGKSSILSALELGLTGRIAHLDGRSNYKDFLTNFDAHSGSVELVAENLSQSQGNTLGRLNFAPSVFESSPALSILHSSFFSERCFLPQGVLGRLLEIYDEQGTNTNSRLTQFVKELLRLEPLDALTEGLSHAFNVTRVRKLAPAYKQLEALLENYNIQSTRLQESVESASAAINARIARLNELMSSLSNHPSKIEKGFSVDTLRGLLANGRADEKRLSGAIQEKSEVASLLGRLTSLGDRSPDANIAEKERVEAQFSAEYQSWLTGPGAQISQAVNELRSYNPDISTSDSDMSTVIDGAIHWCKGEIGRCNRILEQHVAADVKLVASQGIVQRATTRIREINELLTSGVKDAKTLANALAGIAPHMEGNICPVCSRDYGELHAGTLTSHIAATIANLSTEAGRLQALASERATENELLTTAQRDVIAAERGMLDANAILTWRQRLSAIASINSRLTELHIESLNGRQINARLLKAKIELSEIRKAAQSSATLLPEIHMVVEKITGNSTTTFPTLKDGLLKAQAIILSRISEAEARLTSWVGLASELDHYEREFELHSNREKQQQEIRRKSDAIRKTISEVGDLRETAKTVAAAAAGVRSSIVRDVFSGSLNKVWRDLFVRLAPSEQFIPQFQLPPRDDGQVEAVLETLHKSGLAGGAPGTMLSQGNLNTAALTLFLALHLSVPSQLPWLVLDDPVQSMDDLHVAQFAALLRTLSKGLGKQVIVAVHERALFDYLTLELSPAFAGDSLLTVEISRNFQGETIAHPRYFEFEVDKALTA